jgi:hypothetical protein
MGIQNKRINLRIRWTVMKIVWLHYTKKYTYIRTFSLINLWIYKHALHRFAT